MTKPRIEESDRLCPPWAQPFHSHVVQKEKARADSTTVMSTFMMSRDPQAGHLDEAYIMGVMPHLLGTGLMRPHRHPEPFSTPRVD